MSTDGWKNFGKYGANLDPENRHGKIVLGRALEDALERMIIDGGISGPWDVAEAQLRGEMYALLCPVVLV